jgi:hypothetical protein
MRDNTPQVNPHKDPALGRIRSYDGHLKAPAWNAHTTLTDAHRLVIFHYVTRSVQDYITRNMPRAAGSGKFAKSAKEYKKQLSNGGADDPFDPKRIAAFERKHGFDGSADVRASAQAADYTARCCRT